MCPILDGISLEPQGRATGSVIRVTLTMQLLRPLSATENTQNHTFPVIRFQGT